MTVTSRIFKFSCLKSELRLDITLQCGQSFRWREVNPGMWRGFIGKKVWTLSQDDSHILYQTHTSGQEQQQQQQATPATIPKRKRKSNLKVSLGSSPLKNFSKTTEDCKCDKELDSISEMTLEAMLKDYFQLDVPLEKMYSVWAKADANFAAVCPQFPGVRMLNQDPVENVFSFICSSNNNIQRITMLVDRLCQLYGSPLVVIDGVTWYSFPEISSLAAPGVEETLRQQGFGYRAKFIHKSAQIIMEKGGEAWLHSLRSLPYQECHLQLIGLTGIGAKVSDCICLMSMGHLCAIPVDTHVFQIAARDYLPHLRSCKTVTDKVYQEIANHFRGVFGEYAGWAHSVLFSADLKKFETLKTKDKLPKKKKQKTKMGST